MGEGLMLKSLLCTVAGVAVLVAVGAPASAQSQPKKAKTLKAELVGGYGECTSPNTTTGGVLSLPACSPPVRNDEVCSFGPKGSGKVIAKVKGKGEDSDILIKAILKGLQGCEGETLCPVASVRVTTDNCSNGLDCTAVDVENLQVGIPAADGCCIVENGKCKAQANVNEQIAGAIVGNNNTGLQILGCGVNRVTGSPSTTGPSFTCGLLVP